LNIQSRTVRRDEGEVSVEKSVKKSLNEILTSVPVQFNVADLYVRIEKHEPYVSICFQEYEIMSVLMVEIKRSLTTLDMGLSREPTISEAMDVVMLAIYVNGVTATWVNRAYFSLHSLMPW
jgi:dynein heavy chain